MAHKSTLTMTREQWMAERKMTVGSSDVGAILGISGYDTALDVFQVKTGIKPPFEGNKNTEWGTELEDFCALMFERKEMNPVQFPVGRIVRDNKIRFHKTYSWACCNLDRLIIGTGDPIILELKTTTSFAMKGWDAAVPTTYYAQVQWQMFVTGYKKAIIWVAVLDRKEFVRLDVEYSQKFMDAALPEIEKFVVALQTGDSSGLSMQLADFERMRPVEGTRVEATPDILLKLTTLTALKAQKAETEKSEKALSAEIKLFIGASELLVEKHPDGDRVLATYKTQHKDAYTVQASDYRSLNLQREKKLK